MIVNIPDERPYDVRIGADVLDGLGNYLRRIDATANAPRILVISDKSSRPLFQDIDAARQRCLERAPLYSGVADVEIDTAGKSVPRIAREVQRALEKEGVLCQRRK